MWFFNFRSKKPAHNAGTTAETKVTGVVNDAYGPVIGASVVEKGNPSNGVITDLDGNFELNVTPGATIVVSYVGYESQDILVKEQKRFLSASKLAIKSLMKW